MILTFLARQGGLTRLDYCFHVNAYKHLTAKGLPAAVIQLGLKTTRGRVKRPLVGKSILLELEELTGSEKRATEFFFYARGRGGGGLIVIFGNIRKP